jgi:hypothetical protein
VGGSEWPARAHWVTGASMAAMSEDVEADR